MSPVSVVVPPLSSPCVSFPPCLPSPSFPSSFAIFFFFSVCFASRVSPVSAVVPPLFSPFASFPPCFPSPSFPASSSRFSQFASRRPCLSSPSSPSSLPLFFLPLASRRPCLLSPSFAFRRSPSFFSVCFVSSVFSVSVVSVVVPPVFSPSASRRPCLLFSSSFPLSLLRLFRFLRVCRPRREFPLKALEDKLTQFFKIEFFFVRVICLRRFLCRSPSFFSVCFVLDASSVPVVSFVVPPLPSPFASRRPCLLSPSSFPLFFFSVSSVPVVAFVVLPLFTPFASRRPYLPSPALPSSLLSSFSGSFWITFRPAFGSAFGSLWALGSLLG